MLYEEVLSHSSLLETITAKSASISENFVTQLELQDLQERYNGIKDNALVMSRVSDWKCSFMFIYGNVFQREVQKKKLQENYN